MAKTININTGFMKFTFTDEDGDVFASFKLNPTDARLVNRCKNISEFFADLSRNPIQVKTVEDMTHYENVVEDKFCEFLGYDCRQSLFGRVAATDRLPDGRIFASHVLDTIIREIGPEIQKRRQANIARHTAKYAQ